jgi:hypothetical protein
MYNPRQYRNNAAFAGFIHGLDTTCPGALFFRPQEIIEQRNENVEILWWHRVMPVMVFHAQVEGDPKACVDAVMDVFHHNDVADEYQHSGWEPPRVEYQVDRHQWCAVDDKEQRDIDWMSAKIQVLLLVFPTICRVMKVMFIRENSARTMLKPAVV